MKKKKECLKIKKDSQNKNFISKVGRSSQLNFPESDPKSKKMSKEREKLRKLEGKSGRFNIQQRSLRK